MSSGCAQGVFFLTFHVNGLHYLFVEEHGLTSGHAIHLHVSELDFTPSA